MNIIQKYRNFVLHSDAKKAFKYFITWLNDLGLYNLVLIDVSEQQMKERKKDAIEKICILRPIMDGEDFEKIIKNDNVSFRFEELDDNEKGLFVEMFHGAIFSVAWHPVWRVVQKQIWYTTLLLLIISGKFPPKNTIVIHTWKKSPYSPKFFRIFYRLDTGWDKNFFDPEGDKGRHIKIPCLTRCNLKKVTT